MGCCTQQYPSVTLPPTISPSLTSHSLQSTCPLPHVSINVLFPHVCIESRCNSRPPPFQRGRARAVAHAFFWMPGCAGVTCARALSYYCWHAAETLAAILRIHPTRRHRALHGRQRSKSEKEVVQSEGLRRVPLLRLRILSFAFHIF